MNKLEFWLMNNPVRSFVQKFEARRMRKMSDLQSGAVVLESGSGQGVEAIDISSRRGFMQLI